MSLRFDATKCNPPTPKDENDRILQKVLIFFTEFIGISEITEKNYKQVYARIHAIELLEGAHRVVANSYGDKEVMSPIFISVSDVQRWIGMTTNASLKSRTEFIRRIQGSIDRFEKEI